MRAVAIVDGCVVIAEGGVTKRSTTAADLPAWQEEHGRVLRESLATAQQLETLREAVRDYLVALDHARRVAFMSAEIRHPAFKKADDAEQRLRTLTQASS